MKDKCPFCNCPSKNMTDKIECSNPSCWEEVIKKVVENKKQAKIISGSGETSADPIIVRCPQCNDAARPVAIIHASAYCPRCIKWFPYTYEPNKWYQQDARRVITIYKYLGEPSYWDWVNKITKRK